jgi:multidrug efflux system membrane fusion protein
MKLTRIISPAWLLVLALSAGCSDNGKTMERPPVPVVVAHAVKKTLPFEVSSIGNVEAYRTVSVRAQVGGVLSEVRFQEGDRVKKGAPLLLIDPAPYRAALQAARAKLARDQATAANLEQTVRRYDELARKNFITAQQHNDMLTQLEAMKATVRADSAEVLSASLNLDYCSIASPIDGRIGERLVDEGNVVKANSDSPLVVIHQIEPVYVRFTVPERYLTEILRLSASQPLEVRANAPEEPPGAHTGHLTFIDNAVNAATGTIMLKAEFPNPDAMMWPGEFVNVVLVLKELQDAVVIPAQAIGTGQQGDYVFVVKPDATVELRRITVDYRLNNDAVVGEGIASGEKIVIDGQLRLRAGSAVVEKPPVNSKEAGSS